MDIGSIFLILALLILVALFVSRPFFSQKQETVPVTLDPQDHERSSLLAERDRLLNALQELDFDATLGKIPEEDYPAQREVLVRRGAAVLRRLDEMQTGAPEQDAEARLEAAIAARRADSGRLQAAAPVAASVGAPNGHKASPAALASANPDDAIEVMLSDRRRARQEKSGGFCPKCGRSVQKSDRFCPKCGAKLA